VATLTPEQEAWLRGEIAKGHFATPEDAISFAISEAKRRLFAERSMRQLLEEVPTVRTTCVVRLPTGSRHGRSADPPR
jgi:hypothetical protein